MVKDVLAYCKSCTTCQRSKSYNQQPYGLLNSLTVPSHPWEAIGIDFVGPLPLSKNRDAEYDSVMVVIDLLTGMVHLVPSRTTYTAQEVAELIFSEVYKLHGLPKAIVSDQDILFTSRFWSHFQKLIGVKQKMSSTYHPETDGAIEQANHTVNQMLRSCISPNQQDWVSRLPAIEFTINIATLESTGYSPFFTNYGRMPRPMIWNNPEPAEYLGVRTYAQKLKHTIMSAHDSMITT
jgi:transposase InsO family protein